MVKQSCSITFEQQVGGVRALFTSNERRGPRAFSQISEWDALAQLIRTTSDSFDFKFSFTGKPGEFTVTIEGIDDTADGKYVDMALALLLERNHMKLGISFVRRKQSNLPQVFAVPSGSLSLGLVPVLA